MLLSDYLDIRIALLGLQFCESYRQMGWKFHCPATPESCPWQLVFQVKDALAQFETALTLDPNPMEAQAALYNKACCHASRWPFSAFLPIVFFIAFACSFGKSGPLKYLYTRWFCTRKRVCYGR